MAVMQTHACMHVKTVASAMENTMMSIITYLALLANVLETVGLFWHPEQVCFTRMLIPHEISFSILLTFHRCITTSAFGRDSGEQLAMGRLLYRQADFALASSRHCPVRCNAQDGRHSGLPVSCERLCTSQGSPSKHLHSSII